MSDPSKNVEINDVLSSIRKLVDDGENGRSDNTASDASPSVYTLMPDARKPASSSSDKLVLTPAFLVARDAAGKPAEPPSPVSGTDAHAPQDPSRKDAPLPLPLTNMVSGQASGMHAARKVALLDRSQLVATIAELEAAVSSIAGDYEPDGSETVPQTIPWPVSTPPEVQEEKKPVSETPAPQTPAPEAGTVARHPFRETPAEPGNGEEPAETTTVSAPEEPQESSASPDDTKPDGASDTHDIAMDQDAIRALVADIVREELTGAMGERITRNVRKLVRREIYRILSSKEFD